jgi:transcriptional regulator with XRE-family HTH domain
MITTPDPSSTTVTQQAQALLRTVVALLESDLTASHNTDDALQYARASLGVLEAGEALGTSLRGRALGDLVRSRRKAAKLSLLDVSKSAGIHKNTVHNIEQGTHSPSADTLRRLFGVPELKLSTADLTSPLSDWQPNSWVAHGYDPVQMTLELIRLVNGSGGSMEQTFLYLDGQSAADWLSICSMESFADSFRKTRPLPEAAQQVMRFAKDLPLDVNALGPGDGKSEATLVSHLLDLNPEPGMRLHLLDVSHPLLVASWNLAVKTFQQRDVHVLALHGDFHKLSVYEPLQAGPEATTRRRVYTLLGYTLSNLENELRWFESLASCAAPGDLCIIDLQTAYASTENADEIREKDPGIHGALTPGYLDWISGPIRRYGRGVRDVQVRRELVTECPVPGSYEINLVAKVAMDSGPDKRFTLARFKRYDTKRLGECLRARGWIPEWVKLYGGSTGKAAALMVLRRAAQ